MCLLELLAEKGRGSEEGTKKGTMADLVALPVVRNKADFSGTLPVVGNKADFIEEIGVRLSRIERPEPHSPYQRCCLADQGGLDLNKPWDNGLWSVSIVNSLPSSMNQKWRREE